MDDAAPRTECQSDPLDVARANALLVSLGRDPVLKAGDPLPPFFHQLYFWSPQPPDGLGRDGHPKVGGLIPDLGLPRRMWAGGRLTFHAPLVAGHSATRTSICESHTRKEGRTGPLAFVTLRHDVRQGETLCVVEHQDLVYREDPDPQAPRPIAPTVTRKGAHRQDVRFNQTLLFRYSALTFNGHRIHYDEAYARDVEGYDGLVVHGPLLAQLLMVLATENLGPLNAFRFRATAPLMHHEAAVLCQHGTDLWVEGPDARLCMTAEAEVN
ncbi:FAS1-like dehydratase domain-containing protein [Sulfitobacter sp. JB4-11]|uniref:FAS1-like dehydratase domain-containing protein n=1 Tax=Sulfitobacter rhodophyticola TaxID=3238304 RepID=UPI003D81A745